MVRLLIVDDCPIFRHMIRSFAEMNGEVKVVGEAVNGMDAIDMIKQLSPDILTLDINMPIMGGMEAIENIMSSHPLPILVVTSRNDSETAYKAISKGALEVLPKGDITSTTYNSFSDKIKLLSQVKVISHIRSKKNKANESGTFSQNSTRKEIDIIGIAVSTGGPSALAQILGDLPKSFPIPIVIAQHLSDGFLPGLIKWLDRVSQLTIKQGEPEETIEPGTVYLSPPEYHMVITKKGTIGFKDRSPGDIYFPSCDKLLKSIAHAYKSRSVGIILTGMGSDGLLGMRTIKEQGGFTIAQDEKSSVIFGMPQVVINSGYADKILHLDKISGYLLNILN
ncbi:response regulator receiver modulated CheB methylesterase [Candidatus Magnetomorum sp. HK-1]|nr:response regulator receiver modulated CheB methylesterase [Candidatus Magnetomorum sp. HK-1]